MAKGTKPKSKSKNTDEAKVTKAPSQAKQRKAEQPLPPTREESDDEPPKPRAAPMAREESGDTDYGAWGGGGGGGVPGGWGGNADINSWDMSQSQLGHQRSQSRSPAANPPNNATYGNTAPSRLSPSVAGDSYAEARDSFGYESEGHHDHDQGHWDPPAPNQHLSANNHNPAPSALASPAIRRISMQAPTGGVSSIAAAEAAQAELKSKPIKYTSASAAAKKVEAGNPNAAGNRDSLWSKTHELANNRLPPHATFAPKLRPQPVVLAPGKGTGPPIPDSDLTKRTTAQLADWQTPPAWMNWGGGEPARQQRKAEAMAAQAQPPPKHKKGASWQNWAKMAPAHPAHPPNPTRHAPPSDTSSEEEDWEEDDEWEEQQWDRRGHAVPQHPAQGGAWGRASGGGRGGFGGSEMGGHRGRQGGAGAWPDPGGGGGGGAWGKPAGGGGGGGGGGAGGWGAAGGGGGWDQGGGGGSWEEMPKEWGQTGGHGGGGGWDQPSKKTKQPGNSKHPMHQAWGGAPPPASSMGDWDPQPMPHGKKTKHKQDELGAWGAWGGSPEDDWGGAQAQQPKDKKPKKKENSAAWGMAAGGGGGGDDGWGATPATGGWGGGGGGGGGADGWGENAVTGGGWGAGAGGDGWDQPQPGDKKSKRKSNKAEPQGGAWGDTGGGWGAPPGGHGYQDDMDVDDGWEPNPGEKSWGGWQDDVTVKKGGNTDGAWGMWGDDGLGGDERNQSRVKFASGGGGGAWGSQIDTSRLSNTMANAMGNGSHGAAMHNMPGKNVPKDMASVNFLDSGGAAFGPVTRAFFNTDRPVKDRFHWMFNPDKDERVAAMMTCVQTVSYGLGALGLSKFIQTRERGALFTNAAFRLPDHPTQPVFDWVNFDILQKTMDKTLQESVAFYDPAQIVLVFIYLPSPTGNSVAIWRRKLPVPGNIRRLLQNDLDAVKKQLRPVRDYVLYLEEMPKKRPGPKRYSSKPPAQERVPSASVANPKGKLLTKQLQAQLYAQQPPLAQGKLVKEKPEKKKKRKWWKIFSKS